MGAASELVPQPRAPDAHHRHCEPSEGHSLHIQSDSSGSGHNRDGDHEEAGRRAPTEDHDPQ
eukprot:1983858-Heterocapsa_arctica.AAC.1